MTNLIRYQPTSLNLLDSFDRLFDGLLYDGDRGVPAVDVRETEKGWEMEVDLPGLSERDIEVKLDNNLLTIASKKEEQTEQKRNGYLLRERRNTTFRRSFVLPEEVDRQKIDAEFRNGVLKIAFVKTPAAQPKVIEVKAK